MEKRNQRARREQALQERAAELEGMRGSRGGP